MKVLSLIVVCFLLLSCANKPTTPTKISIGNVNGAYSYLGSGIADIKQNGNDIRMYLTWTPRGKGPHYEVKGKLTGNTIEGEWYSHYAKKGWFYFNAEISPSGKMVDFSKSADPIGSNMNKVKLMKK